LSRPLPLLVLILAIVVFFSFTLIIEPVLSAETSRGHAIFKTECASCHVGGGNILVENKTLKTSAMKKYLENYDTDPIGAIVNQIQNGKSAMPAFKNKLTKEEILEVGLYVFQMAETGW
jgi:cytochrome c6